jgi:UDPglucose 6-dehydrogenase
MTVKIIIQGKGVVGQSTQMFLEAFGQSGFSIEFNDPDKDVIADPKSWENAGYVIICVNTDLNDSPLFPENDTSCVDAAINEALQNGFRGRIILRSTLGVESVRLLKNQLGSNLIVWPEYIREATWREDSVNPNMVVIGGDASEEFAELISAYRGNLILTGAVEAMIAKLSTNTFLAMKVIFANQVRQLSEKNGVSYEIVKHLLLAEGRLGNSHWQTPGPDGQAGYGGKCFPKDVQTFEAALIKSGLNGNLIRAITDLNREMRPNG